MKPLRSLRQCLVDTDLPLLRVIARLWMLEVTAPRPLEVAAELSQLMVISQHADRIWNTLSDEERNALRALMAAGGAMPAEVFARNFGKIRPIGPGRLEREVPWSDPVSAAEGLWYRGLIFQGFAGEGSEAFRVIFVPTELQEALPITPPPETSVIRLEPTDWPSQLHTAGDLLLDDITTALAFVHNGTVRTPVDASGSWPGQTQRALLRSLRDPAAERLDFIVRLMDQLGWMARGEMGRLRLVATPVMEWLQSLPELSRSVLVNAWRALEQWEELWRLTPLQRAETGTWHYDPALARAAVLRHLKALTPGDWYSINGFVAAVKKDDPDFQRPGGDYDTWYIQDADGNFLTGFESWDHVEGALLRALLTGPVWWLGLVELGSERSEAAASAFCVTPQQGTAPARNDSQPVVRPDLTVLMPSQSRFERFQLARIADLVKVADPFVYRLTATSLDRARSQRLELARVLGFLDSLSDAPLPGTIRASLERWQEAGIEVRLGRPVLLSTSDASLMDRILGSPRTAGCIDHLVSPTTAVVLEQQWQNLVAGVAELGFLTELTGLEE